MEKLIEISTQHADSLLLIVPLAPKLQQRLIDRAAVIARHKALDVIVYCPALSTAAPHSASGSFLESQVLEKGMELAKTHAGKAVESLRSQGIAARAYVDAQQSVVRGALDQIEALQPKMMMLSSSDYEAWSAHALTEGGLIERCPVPIWVENAAKADTCTVLGAVELYSNDGDGAVLDEQVAGEAEQLASEFGARAHVVHTLTTQSKVPQFIESALPGQIIDQVQQDLEDARCSRAHELAARHDIARENIHLERGKVTDALAKTAQEVKASIVVMGASPRSALTRLLFVSPPNRLLDNLHADVLIVNQQSV